MVTNKKGDSVMAKFTEKLVVAAMKLGMKIIGSDVSQDEALEALGDVTVTDGMPEILREAASETAVLISLNSFIVGSRFIIKAEVTLLAKASLQLFDGKLMLISLIVFISIPPMLQVLTLQKFCTYCQVCLLPLTFLRVASFGDNVP